MNDNFWGKKKVQEKSCLAKKRPAVLYYAPVDAGMGRVISIVESFPPES
jgi:hypothetical protein